MVLVNKHNSQKLNEEAVSFTVQYTDCENLEEAPQQEPSLLKAPSWLPMIPCVRRFRRQIGFECSGLSSVYVLRLPPLFVVQAADILSCGIEKVFASQGRGKASAGSLNQVKMGSPPVP